MTFVKSVTKFLADTKPVPSIAELEAGRAGAEGIVRVAEEGPLISPVRGQHCVAFYYKAYHLVGSRAGQMMPRQLKAHEVYHTFDLELTDGRVKAIPKKTQSFSSDEHKELSGMGYEGFRAIEDLVLPGTRVKIFGVAKKQGDDWVLVYNKLEMVEGAVITPDTSGVKKKKKKLKKKGKARKKAK